MDKVKKSKHEIRRFGLYGIEYPAPPDPKGIAVRISTDWSGRIDQRKKRTGWNDIYYYLFGFGI